ncbi:MAG: alpha/beta fold hydrolase [Betaproteobacteria bacterium]|nr:alpha/beta fold hydrolase [Betaproteobacteria bacterium]
MPKSPHLQPTDLRGYARLAFDATSGLTDLVEALHGTILNPLRKKTPGQPIRTHGITGMVYRTIGGVTNMVGSGVDALLGALPQAVEEGAASPEREAIVSALNGVMGDYLAASGNPLALAMTIRSGGRPLTLTRTALKKTLPEANGRVLLLIHGLCMNDLQWTRAGHNHGTHLAAKLGFTPVYLRYNTGLHIADNGRELSALLEKLVAAWPVAVRELVIVGHSMGGLVARSACVAADLECRQTPRWRKLLKRMVFLGTPHFGAPLERGGHWVDLLLGATPWSAPFAQLGKIRSEGITDLRHGTLVDATHHPLPRGVRCHAVAATTSRATDKQGLVQKKLWGDGLVPIDSALGLHADPALALKIPAARRMVVHSTNHLDLLCSAPVAEKLEKWLKG